MAQETRNDEHLAALMRAAQSGDGRAYARLLEQLVPRLRHIVRAQRQFLQAPDVEDVVQDVLLSLHAVRATYDPRRPFMPWLLAIVRHRLADAARRHARGAGDETQVGESLVTFSPHQPNMEPETHHDPEAVRHRVRAFRSGRVERSLSAELALGRRRGSPPSGHRPDGDRSTTMKRLASAFALIALLSSPALGADDHLITKKSAHNVSPTLDRLVEALKQRSIAVVARVDHAAAAQKAGQALRPTEVLIFGNPKLGTPLMQANRKIGLDLPMKVLAWEDDSGQAWLAYTKPEHLKAQYAVSGQDETFREMAQALDRLTDEASKR
jgi:RNA polymerase sigma factor (sigma-70 family)